MGRWRLPLVPLAPILFVLASAAIFNQLRADLTSSAISLLIVASGIPAYYLWDRKAL